MGNAQTEIAADAAAIAGLFALSDDARALLRPQVAPEGFIHALDRAGLHLDAFRFLAHWLENREAIWWGCQCAWEVYRPQPPAPVDVALGTLVRWVLEPLETLRRQAEAASNELGADTPVGCLALAVFGSGGSLSLPDLPAVEPPPYLTAQCVAGAVVMASVQGPTENIPYYQRLFVSLGLDVAHGKNLW